MADRVFDAAATNGLPRHERRAVFVQRLLTMPALIVIGIFGVVPLVIALAYSFLEPAPYGGVEWRFSTDAYVSLLFQKDLFDETWSFVPDYLLIFWRTVVYAFLITVICLLLGFPTAYFMATRLPAQRNRWVLLVTIPFWSNMLIRIMAIMLIIRDQGLINGFLIKIGLIDQPIPMLYPDFAIVLGLFYSFLPLMVLPLFSSLERFDLRLVEAGLDLYATRRKVLTRIVIPLAKPGIIAGCILVFIPALGAYSIPLILGAGTRMMAGNLIALQFGSSRNWPLGAAQAALLMTGVIAALIFHPRKGAGKVDHG
ncbi:MULTISPECIES: ABC transporter permease [unclassified Rhizobium]|uniref:ABC transporter permease n=1 Tax=unclassified Rhizobium TaxID=2613769 RepID=UPI0006F3448A|nr:MULTISPECIES: ABC transporter permease [unclassified Rhizobium]KQV41772.1 ABC transporter permease [Rhizobium sp. Root1212]KRD30019.1 ABC transporter permease [Rhizobium sp. Root268]